MLVQGIRLRGTSIGLGPFALYPAPHLKIHLYNILILSNQLIKGAGKWPEIFIDTPVPDFYTWLILKSVQSKKGAVMIKLYLLLAVAIVMLSGAAGCELTRPAGIRILTEEYAPLNYTDNNTVTGLSVQVVEELLKAMHRTADIEVVDWAEGYRMAQEGPNTALFSTVMTQERRDLFKWAGPLATVEARLYARKCTSLSIKSLDDAKAVSAVATVRDYYMEQELAAEGFTNLMSCATGAEAAQKVLNGEADLMPYNNVTMPLLLAQLGADADALVPVYDLSIDLAYIAFSKDVPDATIQQWQDALDGLKSSGSFDSIYAKWLPEETPPGILQLMTEDYPPITFMQDGEAAGLATDMVKEICTRISVPDTIRMTAWAGAYELALVNPNVVLFSTERTEQREDLFNWVGPLGHNITSFYSRKGSGITVQSLDEAKKIGAIGTTTGWFSEQYLQGQGFTNLVSSPLPSATVEKLINGEVDLAVFTDLTIPEILEEAGYTRGDIEPVFTIMTSYFYIAISLGTPQDTVYLWQDTLDAMKEDGTFEQIYETYVPGADLSDLL